MKIRAAGVLSLILVIGAAACGPAPSAIPGTVPPPSPTTSSAKPAPTVQPSPRPTLPATPAPTPEPTPASAILPGAVGRSSLDISATYDVALDITVATGAIHVGVVIDARNESGEPIDRLELNTIAARLGNLDVKSAEVDDRAVAVVVDDQTLIVPLGGILPAGASTIIELSYTATLRPALDGSNWLFSRAGGTLTLYRWIPWISRAVPFDRPNHGDPFVTPSSPRVRVFVTTDVQMVLASPSVEVLFELRSDGMAWSLELYDVRDVALVLAPDFELTSGDADGIRVRAYTRPGGLDGERLVAEASRALRRMAGQLGVPYPWPAFSIVETAGGYGMESPGMVWIPTNTEAGNMAYLVHHETAHQWFYGLVGNDQQAEPFADEAAADLLARTILGSLRGSRCNEAPLDDAITGYSRACYYEVVYIQGGRVLDDLRAEMGTEPFWRAMRAYLEANRFEVGGTRELLETLRAGSPADLLPTLRARFPSLY